MKLQAIIQSPDGSLKKTSLTNHVFWDFNRSNSHRPLLIKKLNQFCHWFCCVLLFLPMTQLCPVQRSVGLFAVSVCVEFNSALSCKYCILRIRKSLPNYFCLCDWMITENWRRKSLDTVQYLKKIIRVFFENCLHIFILSIMIIFIFSKLADGIRILN